MILKINGKIERIYDVTSEYNSLDSIHTVPHHGIDLAVPYGTDLFSPVEGVAHIVDYGNANIGKGVIVKLQDGSEVVFGHMSRINVRDGDIIQLGQNLGKSGNSGFSDGSHLHIGLISKDGKFLDPSQYERGFQKIMATHQKAKEVLAQNVSFSGHYSANKYGLVGGDRYGSLDIIQQFITDVHDDGLWYALFHETFGQSALHFAKWLAMGFLSLNDLFFLMPAIFIFFTTMLVGRNRFTKYGVPCFFGYFVTQIIKYSI